MNRKKVLSLLTVCAVFCLSGCGEKTTSVKTPVKGLEKLGNTHVIAREEGSGTRSTFAALAGFAESENDTGSSDQTRKDAVVAKDAEEVMFRVGADQSAVGYLSLASLEKGKVLSSSIVKEISVEGVKPGEGNEKYPLRRSFFLAYNGKLSELEQDFLTYVKGAGQEVVGQSFGTAGKSSTFLSNKAKGTLTISGSSSVVPLMKELIKGYWKYNSNAQIEVKKSDSTTGLNEAMAGTCNFGMSSRELKEYEKELLEYETIAEDEIAVVVSIENPLEDITLEQLRKIYTGEIKSWDELNTK